MQFKQQYRTGEPGDEWCTPNYIFEPINRVFRFTVDAAANSENTKCSRFLDDGLEDSWRNEVVWCNCPYTNGSYKYWIQKALEEWRHKEAKEIALLLPASWETKAFNPIWEHARYLIFPYARIKFELDGESQGGAPFSSLIAVFTSKTLDDEELEILGEIGRVIDLEFGYVAGYGHD